MKLDKKLLFRIHGWIGIKLGILFFVVCFSGTLATLSSEIDWLINPSIRAKPLPVRASKGLIVNNFHSAFPNYRLEFLLSAREPYLCDILYASQPNGHRSYVFANPYTGKSREKLSLLFNATSETFTTTFLSPSSWAISLY